MTALEVVPDHPNHAPAVRDHQSVAVERLTEWAHSAQAAMQVAEGLSRSSFVPSQFRGKPEDATAAILSGLEVGLQPMQALRAFDIIQGSAAPKAITLRAVVLSHGHEMTLVESTATRCVMRGRRRGASEWQTVTWTKDRAADMSLLGKDNWKKQPQAMLVARATSELARLIAADAILGIGYSSEEVADGATGEPPAGDAPELTESTEDAPSGKKRMSRKQSAPSDEDITDAEVVDGDGVTDAQIRKMAATFRDIGITERGERLAYISATVDREVESSKDLTKSEASTVIEALVATQADDDNPASDTLDLGAES